MSSTGRAWARPLASLLALVAVGTGLAAVVVVQAAGAWDLGPGPQVLVDAAVAVGYAPIAVVVLTAPRVTVGTRRLAVVLLVSGVAAGAAALTTACALAATEETTAAQWLVHLQSWLWVPGFFPLLTLVPLLYPDGLLPGRVWRLAAGAGVAGVVLLSAGVALHPETFAGQVGIDKPVASDSASTVLTVPGAVLLLLTLLAAVASLAVRLRTSSGLRRRQVVVLLAAAAVLLGVTLAQGPIPAPADVLVQAAATLLVPLAIGVAVTRHGLYDLDVSVRHALVALSLVVCLAGLYLTVFSVLRSVTGSASQLSAALAAGLAGVAIQPLARRLTAGVDRLFYGDRGDPWAVLTGLNRRLAEAPADMASVPSLVCATVVDALRLPTAELHVAGDPRPAGAAGEPSSSVGAVGVPVAFSLRHRGTEVGVLTVHTRAGEPELDPRDAEVVASVAAQAAPAVAALQLRRQLQRSREHVVTAREAERRRLRRELHDGLGASLAGLRLQIESAQALSTDPAATLLHRAADGVSQAVDEVRSLCEGLRPPGIDDLGLPLALRLLGERLGSADLRVAVEVPDELEVGAAVESAVYRIVAEGLTNVVKHAGAGRADVTVTPRGDELEVVVADDGVGLGTARDGRTAGSGIGLGSMRERAEEVGGRLTVAEGPGGGTLVVAVLPTIVEETV